MNQKKTAGNSPLEQLQVYRQRFETLHSLFRDVAPFLFKKEDIQKVFDDNRQMIEALASPEFHVCFAGPYSTGKSTLINAILGKDILPYKEIPTTACPTFIRQASKPGKEYGDIYYSTMAQRQELKNAYLTDLALPQNLNLSQERLSELEKLEAAQLLQAINQEVTQFKANIKVLSNDSYQCLQYLLSEWNNKIGHVERDKSIDEIKKVTEFKDDKFDPSAILMSKIDVYLNDLPYDPAVVLVDLPGLGSRNINHERITRSHAFEANTKAFIFIFAPKKLADSKAFQFIAEINNNKRILDKSFWVVNMWDEVKEDEKGLENSFKDGLNNYNISYSESRFFKTSAIEKMNNVPSPLAHNVDDLRSKFFHYLTSQIFEEFLADVKSIYYSIHNKIRDQVESIAVLSDNPDDIRSEFIMHKADDLFEAWVTNSKTSIRDTIIQVNKSVEILDFLRDREIKAVSKNIDVAISSEESFDKLSATKYDRMNDHEARWIEYVKEVVDRFDAGEIMRTSMKKRVQESDIRELVNKFRRIAMQNISDGSISIALPENIQEEVFAYLSEDCLNYRLDGLCDAAVLDYARWRAWLEGDLCGKDTNFKVHLFKHKKYDLNTHFSHFKTPPADPEFWKNTAGDNKAGIDLADFSAFATFFIKGMQNSYIREKIGETNRLVLFSLQNYFKNIKDFYLGLTDRNRQNIKSHIIQNLKKRDLGADLQIQIEKVKSLKQAKEFFSRDPSSDAIPVPISMELIEN